MNKVLGIDIGISSVGWGLIDADEYTILDAGVRLFEEATRNGNEERRNFRSSRRLKRRRLHRLERALKLFESYNLPITHIGKENPYEVRYRAIYGSVTKEELVAALYHIVKRRGTTLETFQEEQKEENELSTKEQLARNKKLLEGKYICEVQLERLKNNDGKLRNHENRFQTEDYVREAQAILYKQKQVYTEITDEFITNFIELIEKRRQYYEGPGSKKSPTPYGRYYVDKNGKISYISMIDKMRGNCTYFPEEPRIAKMSFTAELFDLLNGDLNKLQINGECLTYQDKVYLVENFIKKGKNITLKQVLKYKGATENNDVRGYRIDIKNNKPIFTEFKGYKEILRVVRENNLPEEILDNIDLIDTIAEILTSEKSTTRRQEQFYELLKDYNETTKKQIFEAFKENTKFTGYHSLSKKAIALIMDDLWHTNKNQMELFTEYGLEQKRFSNTGNRYIKFDDKAILSTVAKRAHREAIKIVNEVRRKYGELNAVVVETAREKNSAEEKKAYEDFQKKIGKQEKELSNLLGVRSLSELKLKDKQKLALKLWLTQDGKCIYSGKSILIHDIIQNPYLFEIDHIIPISISFDDSEANKVLCYHWENQQKRQQTPYQYFTSGAASRSRTFDQFKVDVLALYKSGKISNKKKEYLLELRNVQNNQELQKEFINRNLVDTRYAMRSFSMTLRSFFKNSNIDTKVFTVRGSFTSAIRRRAKLKKDRDSHAHHAIDALIVAAIMKMPIFEYFKTFDVTDEGLIFEKETGEILEENQFYSNKLLKFIRDLMNFESKIKYSHKVDKKANRSISNQTIYGTREKDGDQYYINRTGNIYQMNKQEAQSLIKKMDKTLIAQNNPELYKHILKIIDEYRNASNPFKAYYDEHGFILKDGKVPVKKLRYYESKAGVHLDITKKFPKARNNVVLRSIKSLRIDIYKNNQGKYKYLGVPHYWFKKVGNKLVLDLEKYKEEKMRDYKKIDDSFEFQFSLYKNDRFSFEKDDQYVERIFRGDNNPRTNRIEVEFIDRKTKNQNLIYISSLKNIVKYNVDVLGNTYKIEKENFKDTLQIF